MTPTDKLAKELREGLEGVTPGLWHRISTNIYALNDAGTNRFSALVEPGFIHRWAPERGRPSLRTPLEELESNAAHIARCAPKNIRALLDERDADKALIRELAMRLEGARAWIQMANNQVRGISASAAKPSQEVLDAIDATLAKAKGAE